EDACWTQWALGQRAVCAVPHHVFVVLDLDLWVRLAACLPHGLDALGHTAAIARMVRAEPATICVEGQLADAGNQITVGNELAARALLAETEILDLDDHS